MKQGKFKNFTFRIMETTRMKSEDTLGKPTGRPLEIYRADSFKTRPDAWICGPGSFVVVVNPNTGIYFDWKGNDAGAVIPSVRGCNPLTGKKTDSLVLEVINACPNCEVALDGRLCTACGKTWPNTNYVDSSDMRLDGFRAEDGTVRQFYITDDKSKDIASYLIGSDNTVPAFGLAYFKSFSYMYEIYKKLQDENNKKMPFGGWPIIPSTPSPYPMWKWEPGISYLNCVTTLTESTVGLVDTTTATASYVAGIDYAYTGADFSVGAGAKISQNLDNNDTDISNFSKTADSVVRIYVLFKEEFDRYSKDGFINSEDNMLAGLPVG